MALPASLAFCRFGSPTARATLELYLDIVCPFSLKQIRGLKAHVLPVVEKQPVSLSPPSMGLERLTVPTGCAASRCEACTSALAQQQYLRPVRPRSP